MSNKAKLPINDDDDDSDNVKPVKRIASSNKKTYIDDSDDDDVQSIKSDEEEDDDIKTKKKKTAAKTPTPKNDTKTKPNKSPNVTTTSTTATKIKKEDEAKEEVKEQSSSSSSSSSIKAPAAAKPTSIDDLTKGGSLATEQAVKKVLLPYLKRENRPFNVLQLHENFHKRMPKSVLEKALTTLSENNGGVRCKEYGKSKIYFADQSTIPCGSEKEIKELNTEIEKLKRQYESVSQEANNVKSELIKIESEPTDADLIQSLSNLEAKVAEKKQRVSSISDAKLEPNALANAIKEHNYFRTIWIARKRKCNDILDDFIESSNKKKAVMVAEIGIETDEEMKVSMPAAIAEIRK